MAATSPYTQNDYQAVSSFRPYNLPVNDIFKAISAQNAFWDAGAARVKGVYDNVLGLKLSNAQNREMRDNFMREAEKEITKLSAMDLSDPSIQRQGMDIFKPVFQDEGIVSDDAATRHIERVNNDALSYRTKDGGKNYSMYNHQYAMLGAAEFKNSPDRMAGKAYLSKKKEYEPYYDYTEDFTKALKDCKPSSTSTESPFYGQSGKDVTGYSLQQKQKGLAASQARVCLEAGLSPQAQRQMQIEGVVNYANNKDVLAADTVSFLSTVSDNVSDEVQKLSANRSAIRNNKDMKEADKKAAIGAIDERIKGLSDEVTKNNTIVSKLNKGDYTMLDENLEGYAGSVYSFRKLYKKAQASNYSETELNYKDDLVQLQMKKYEQELHLRELDHNYDVSMENLGYNHEVQLKQMDIMGDMMTGSGKGKLKNGAFGKGDLFIRDAEGNITINPDLQWLTPNISDSDTAQKDPKAYQEIQSELGSLNDQQTKNTTRLGNELINRAETDDEFRKELMTAFSADSWEKLKYNITLNRIKGNDGAGIQNSTWFKEYFAGHKDDAVLNDWAEKASNIELGRQTLNKRIELGEKQVKDRLGLTGTPDEMLSQSVKSVKPLTINGVTVTADDVAKGTGKFEVREGNVTINPYGGQPATKEKDFYIDGKKLEGADRAKAVNIWTEVNSKRQELNKKVGDVRAEVYGQAGFARDRWALVKDEEGPAISSIQSAFGTRKDDGSTAPNKGIQIQGTDFSGGMRILHPGVKPEDLATYRNLGIGTDAQIESDGVVVLRGTNYNVLPKAIDNSIMQKTAYNLGTVAATRAFTSTAEGANVKDTDIDIPVYIAGKRQQMTIKTYKIDDNPQFRVYMKDATTKEALATANNAYDLMEKIARMKLEYKQPIK